MSGEVRFLADEKRRHYADLQIELQSILAGEPNMVARMATMACLLAVRFEPVFFWTGFYLVDPARPSELVIGPYQGTLGCMRIPLGKGVCGTSAQNRQTLIVPDVHAFPGHIACDSRSESEIVVPIFDSTNRLYGVLDVDSCAPAAFDEDDRAGLEAMCKILMAV